MDTAKQIIEDLVSRHDLSDSEIARLAGTTQPTIWRIKNDAVSQCGSILYGELVQLRKRLGRSKKKAA